MKQYKHLALLVMLALMLVVFAAALSGCGTDEPAAETEAATETDATEEAEEGGEEAAGSGEAAEGINHIAIFETCVLNAEATDVEGTPAYPLSDFVAANLNATPSGDVTICATDGYSVATTADVLLNYAITLDGDDAPTLVGADLTDELKVKNIQYIQFADEAIYFVEEDFEFGTVIDNLALDENAIITFLASDGFAWDAVDLEDARKTLMECAETTGSSVNAFCFSMGDVGADLRECVGVNIHY